jgi:hypothetical protein
VFVVGRNIRGAIKANIALALALAKILRIETR